MFAIIFPIESWKNLIKNFWLFSWRRNQGFQMKKDQTIAGEKI